jgi:hypothetical protein
MHSARVPTKEEVLSIIDDVTHLDGNTTINEIRLRLMLAFGWHTGPTHAQVQRVLCLLFADDLIVKDGTRHDGAHFALTFKGKRKLNQIRDHRSRAA